MFAKVSSPLHDFINGQLKWTDSQQAAFTTLKDKLLTGPILIAPNPKHTFVVHDDAGKIAAGAECNYPTREIENLAIIHALKTWKIFFKVKPFTLEPDHHSSKYVIIQKDFKRQPVGMTYLFNLILLLYPNPCYQDYT